LICTCEFVYPERYIGITLNISFDPSKSDIEPFTVHIKIEKWVPNSGLNKHRCKKVRDRMGVRDYGSFNK